MIHPMPVAAISRRQKFAFVLLAIGLAVVIMSPGMLAVVGIPIVALGWWAAMEAECRPLTTANASHQRLAWIVASALFLMAGFIGGLALPGLALPALVVLVVGASVWCLVPCHPGLIANHAGDTSWTSLLIAGGMTRWAALTLVARAIEFGMSPNESLTESSQRLIECLTVASGATCAVCIAHLWRTRKSGRLSECAVAAIQIQTAAVLAALAAQTWAAAESITRGASALHTRQWMPFGESLSWVMLCWDSLTLAALCFCMSCHSRQRRVWSAVLTSIILLDLAGVPPLPGFWLKWSALQFCLYPHHIEPFARMFDMHEGFRLLSVLAVITQAGVSMRLLTQLVQPVHANNASTPAILSAASSPERASGLAPSGHE